MGTVCSTPKKNKPASGSPSDFRSLLDSTSKDCFKEVAVYAKEIQNHTIALKSMLKKPLKDRNSTVETDTINNILRHKKLHQKLLKAYESCQFILVNSMDEIKESKGKFEAVSRLAGHFETIIYATELMDCLKQKPFTQTHKKIQQSIIKYYGNPTYKELTQYKELGEPLKPIDLAKFLASSAEISSFLESFAKENQIELDSSNPNGQKPDFLGKSKAFEEKKATEPENGSGIKIKDALNDQNIRASLGRKGNNVQNRESAMPNKMSQFNPSAKHDGGTKQQDNGLLTKIAEQNPKGIEDLGLLENRNGFELGKNGNITPDGNENVTEKMLPNQNNLKISIEPSEDYPGFDKHSFGLLGNAIPNRNSVDSPFRAKNKASSNRFSKKTQYITLKMQNDPLDEMLDFVKLDRPPLDSQNKSPISQAFFEPQDEKIINHDENLFGLDHNYGIVIEEQNNQINSEIIIPIHKLTARTVSKDATIQDVENIPVEFHYIVPGAQQLYEEIKTGLAKRNINYIDIDFPMDNVKSLCNNPSTFPDLERIEWKRAWDQFPKAAILPTANEIKALGPAGKLLNPSILLAAANLAMKPELIKVLIHPHEVAKDGLFAVYLCHGGKWVSVLIDDFLPFIKQTSALAFSQGSTLWLSLLEKALSKLTGSYQQLRSLSDEFVLRAFTGISPHVFHIAEEEIPDTMLLWQMILKLLSDKFTISAKYVSAEGNEVLRISLVINAKVFQGIGNEKKMMVQLEDVFDFEGENKRQSIYKKMPKDSDIPKWVLFSTFRTQFNRFVLFRSLPRAKYHYFELDYSKDRNNSSANQPNVKLIKIIVMKQTHATLSVIQRDHQTEYSLFRMTIGKLDPYGRVYGKIDGNFDQVYDLNFEYTLEEGSYLLMVESFGKTETTEGAVFSAYSSENLVLDLMGYTRDMYVPLLEQFGYAHGHNELNTNPNSDHMIAVEGYTRNIKRVISTRLRGLLVVFYKNDSENEVIHECFTIKNRENLSLVQYVPAVLEPQADYEINISVLPQSAYLAVFRSSTLEPILFDGVPQTMLENISSDKKK